MPGGVPQDGGGLAHFYEEGRFSSDDVVFCAESREDPVDRSQAAFGSRNATAKLRKNDQRGGLTHQSGFTTHVGTWVG